MNCRKNRYQVVFIGKRRRYNRYTPNCHIPVKMQRSDNKWRRISEYTQRNFLKGKRREIS